MVNRYSANDKYFPVGIQLLEDRSAETRWKVRPWSRLASTRPRFSASLGPLEYKLHCMFFPYREGCLVIKERDAVLAALVLADGDLQALEGTTDRGPEGPDVAPCRFVAQRRRVEEVERVLQSRWSRARPLRGSGAQLCPSRVRDQTVTRREGLHSSGDQCTFQS